ncbi:hypothetical protein [Blastococcus sp. KM273129]|uniref:hypothetical protein n=1 Tax=Blastococcus sp. KM273129 TaxID=2570315 RepID=UPI001F47E345|nr:hypothetical protein [Blastococcus sp. KM273129]MCF6734425.1 hypothetical protein [Blastococcus sp. KM273129]
MPSRARLLAPSFPAAALLLAATAAPAGAVPPPAPAFAELATFEVSGEVAEILAVTPDGRTLLYTDSATAEVGLVDLTRPAEPRAIGAVPVDGEPTSVTVTATGGTRSPSSTPAPR